MKRERRTTSTESPLYTWRRVESARRPILTKPIGGGINRHNTSQQRQHTREYLKKPLTGKETKGSVLGTSPYPTKASPGAGTRKIGANKHKTRNQKHRQTTEQKGNHPGNQESFPNATPALFTPFFRHRFDRFLGRRP